MRPWQALLTLCLGTVSMRPFPSAEQAAEANAYAVLHDRAVACAEAFGRNPNLVAVDWYTEGDLFLVVDGLNGM